jgi:hypothetical protein
MLFDDLDDFESEEQQKRQDAEGEAPRLAFGTRPPAPLKPAKQDNLFNPEPQGRLKL